ncbi:MAG: type II toxin-antitoxin system death-on-curing family toxin [Xanthomonadaceae bacterium]|nr:type II toxin-antitoxin system death-on-curing family toxin [Xanthomonadaceae bacterium]MDP2185451.1 type II toxin-antitoxin system death-on-curing family toxin [Xanthomonadales bacterium]MDZ4377019.1 type II toxin-antitoxin system death-on-curing family toxin [Xanthomonadaceae bacterium]
MLPVIYLSVDQVLAVHRRVIQEFGGDPGLRDRGVLESAVAMPQSSFGGEDLHHGLAEKAAAYHFHICANHAFIDGNKRVAVTAAEIFLLLNGYELGASDAEVEGITMGVAGGKTSKDQVSEFYVRLMMEAV